MTTVPEQCSIRASRRALIMHKAKRTPRQISLLQRNLSRCPFCLVHNYCKGYINLMFLFPVIKLHWVFMAAVDQCGAMLVLHMCTHLALSCTVAMIFIKMLKYGNICGPNLFRCCCQIFEILNSQTADPFNSRSFRLTWWL